MNKMPKNKREKLIATIIGAIVLITACWLLLLNPQRRSINAINTRIASSQQRLDRATKSIAAAERVQLDVEISIRRLKERENSLATGDMYSWIIQTINGFKRPYNVDIPQFSREMATEAGIFPNYPYQASLFNLRGTAYYHDFGQFLAGLENTFPYIRVQNLELEAVRSASAEEREKLAFKFELVALTKPTAL